LYPTPYKEHVLISSEKYEIDPFLIYAVMKAESKFNPHALSRKGAKGLMQMMDTTGAWIAEITQLEGYSSDQLFAPQVNIELATWYISRLLKQYDGDVEMMLMAYNAGSGNVSKWKKDIRYSEDGITIHTIPFKETKEYLKKVKRYYTMYKWLYRL
jgi:soluble lytic murein transglycosylase